MKKIITYFLIVFSFASIIYSCDKDNYSDATMTYYGRCDNLSFTKSFSSFSDSVIFDSLVRVALDDLGYSGEKSLFQESSKVDVSAPVYAVAKCNEQAVKTYENKIKSITLHEIKSCIFSMDCELIEGKFETLEQLPLNHFDLTLELVNYGQGSVKKFNFRVN